MASTLACGQGHMLVLGETDPRARTIVVGLAQDRLVQVVAGAAEEPLSIEFPSELSADEPVWVNRLQLAESMTELGLREVKLVPAASPNRPLSSISALQSELAQVSSGEEVSFEAAEPLAELAAFLIPDTRPCPRFSLELVEEGSGFSQGAVSLEDGRHLLATLDGLFVIGGQPELSFRAFEGEAVHQVALDPEGQPWLLTNRTLSRLDVDSGTRTLSRDTSHLPSGSGGLVVTSADPFRAYVFDLEGTIHLLDDEGVRVHQVLPRVYRGRPTLDRMWLASRGNGAFLGGAHYFVALMEFDGENYSYFAPEGLARGFAGIGRTKDGRFFTNESFSGVLYFETDAGWATGPKLSTRIFSYASYGPDELMVFASNEALLGVFDLKSGLVCEALSFEGFTGIRDIVRVRDRYFVAGVTVDNIGRFGWLTPL